MPPHSVESSDPSSGRQRSVVCCMPASAVTAWGAAPSYELSKSRPIQMVALSSTTLLVLLRYLRTETRGCRGTSSLCTLFYSDTLVAVFLFYGKQRLTACLMLVIRFITGTNLLFPHPLFEIQTASTYSALLRKATFFLCPRSYPLSPH